MAQIVADYNAGVSSDELVTTYTLSKGAVIELLHQHGVTMRRPPLSEAELAEAIQLYAAGWSCARIGQQFQRKPSVVWRGLKRAGVTLRGPHER